MFPRGISYLGRQLPQILEDGDNGLVGASRELFARLFGHFRELDLHVQELEGQIKAWHRQNTESRRLEDIPGIGPLTASPLVASVSDANAFKNGRQFAARLGLVPRQDSSGGKERCSASASEVTRTCARYSFTALVWCCYIQSGVLTRQRDG